jgi:hypothetical protein
MGMALIFRIPLALGFLIPVFGHFR